MRQFIVDGNKYEILPRKDKLEVELIERMTELTPEDRVISIPDRVTFYSEEYEVVLVSSEYFKNKKSIEIESLFIPKNLKRARNSFQANVTCRNLYYNGTLEDWFKKEFEESTRWMAKNYYFLNNKKEYYAVAEELVIPNSITRIGNYQCYGLNFTKVVIPTSVKEIGVDAFKSNITTKYVYYEGSLEDWLKIKFESANSNPMCNGLHMYFKNNGTYKELTSFDVPEGITYLGQYSVYMNRFVQRLTLPNSLTYLEDSAIIGCSRNKSYLYDTVHYLGSYSNPFLVAYRSKSLQITRVSLHPYTKFVDAYTFSECSNVHSVDFSDNIISIGQGAFQYCCCGDEVKLPRSLKTIGDSAFYGSKIEVLHIPKTLTKVGSNAFANNPKLEKVYYDGTLADWCNIDFENEHANPLTAKTKLFVKDMNNKYYEVNKIDIPTTLKVIKSYAFANYGNFTELNIKNNIKSIGKGAFQYCENLVTVNLSDDINTIGDGAFQYCKNLENINIPDKIKSLGSYVFNGCKNLKLIEENKLLYLGSKTNPYIYLHSRVQKLALKYTINKDTKIIGDEVFFHANYVFKIEIPDNVFHIGNSAFKYSSFKQIKLPQNLVDIKDRAFENNKSLASIELSEKTKRIGALAFNGCKALKRVLLPSEIASIGDNAFAECNKLTLYFKDYLSFYSTDNEWNPLKRPVEKIKS